MYIYYFLLAATVSCQAPATDTETSLSAAPDTVITVALSQDALLGKVNPNQDTSFRRIDAAYTDKPDIFLRRETYGAFVQMAEAAQQEGISLRIVSATRNFNAQKRIWEAKWNGQRKVGGADLSKTIPAPEQRALKILEYSSMPGTSRHHWGTDIDLNTLENDYFSAGEGKKVYDWLQAHAADYGFCQVYTEVGEDRPQGYQEERWHWSYLPLAHQFLRQYNQQIDYSQLIGFEGSEAAEAVKAIENYVNGIAPRCTEKE